MRFKENEIINVRQKHLYWVQIGSRVLNATVDSNSRNADALLRARILKIEQAPAWGDLAFLAVEGQLPPDDCALVALCKNCMKV